MPAAGKNEHEDLRIEGWKPIEGIVLDRIGFFRTIRAHRKRGNTMDLVVI